ncbi:MAG TPA: polysaccharide lyase family protein [Phycisphaerae bacterium]|nr:polysaccharide lyase family protein [Phycisphaerae bacterium]HRY69723.1 polysaccharide lyase family protein [Phycisphaerae bacterium]HSA25080.1 polysaccharide lyase family protein [Phycisphaerae bacterium]
MTRHVLASLTVLLAFSAGTTSGADTDVLWQIGKTNKDYHDLGNAGDVFGGYTKAFPRDVRFTVGKSDPAKDFSASHPGPVDAWAGNKTHPFRINFDLQGPPATAYELRIDVLDTQGSFGPTLRVKVNEQSTEIPLERGAGDMVVLHPEMGKNRALKFMIAGATLKPEGNTIELTVTRGSWLLYDAISLAKLTLEANVAPNLSVKPSLFFVEKEGKLQQELTVSVDRLLTTDLVKIEVRSGEQQIGSGTLGRPMFGIASGPLHVAEATTERELVVTVSAGSQAITAKVTQKPQKKWRIYCAPSTHTDIGYTAQQEAVVALHNRNTDLALELSAEFPLYHWNLESSWAAQMWLRDNPPYRHEELYKAAREHRVGIETTYLNMLTGLCSDEELIRNMYYSARLHREHAVPFESYTLTDAPSHVWGLPSILAGAGVRYISIGSNQTRAPILKQNLHHKCPFWWEGPDGQRVLLWNTSGYSQAGNIGLREGMARMRQAIESDLMWWNGRSDYPYDAILLHGAYSDNVAIGRDIAESITEYSKHYAYPKVILCSNDTFMKHIEKNFAGKIPVVRGCGGSWWEDGAGSSAVETAITRVAHQDIIAAETAWAVATGGKPIPLSTQTTFDEAWNNILLYDEHTWGAHNSIAEPDSDFVTRQWAVKAQYAYDAADASKRLLDQALVELAGQVNASDNSLLVFNPAGRSRTGLVKVDLPRELGITDEQGTPVPSQIVRQDVMDVVTKMFRASDVPAVGYRTYKLIKETTRPAVPPRFNGTVLENDFYKVSFDPATGGILSLLDKKLNKELVDSAGKYRLGQLVYAAGGKCVDQYNVDCPNFAEVRFSSPERARIEAGLAGPVYTSARTVANMPMFHRIELETILYEQERRVDFVVRLNKKMTREKEAVYIAFPFAGAEPRFRYEIGGGSVRPNEDHWPGGCRDWFSVQRWVTVNTNDVGVVWSAVDTPLITLCDMTPGKWLDELPITNGTVFAYALNNYWFTNYKAGQDGEFVFRYSLTSDARAEPATATLFGEDVQSPMRAVRLFAGRRSPKQPTAASLCEVQPSNVIITAVKPADDGKGVIVRVRETAGQATEAKVAVRFPGVTRVTGCDLVERNRDALAVTNGQVTVKLAANAMAAIRLEAGAERR